MHLKTLFWEGHQMAQGAPGVSPPLGCRCLTMNKTKWTPHRATLQGTRQKEHVHKWINNVISHLDSYYEESNWVGGGGLVVRSGRAPAGGGQHIWTEASVKIWAVQRAVWRTTWAEATANEKALRLGLRRACGRQAGGGQCGDRRGERALARPQDSVSWVRSWADGSQWRSHCIPAAKKQWRLGTERAGEGMKGGWIWNVFWKQRWQDLWWTAEGKAGLGRLRERNSGYFLVWGLSNWVDSSTKMEKTKERSK